MLIAWITGFACAQKARPLEVVTVESSTIFLARTPLASVALPESSPLGAAPVGEDIAIEGPWKLERTVGDVAEFRGPLPVLGALVTRTSPSEGFVITGPSGPLPWSDAGKGAPQSNTYEVKGQALLLRLPVAAGAPVDGEWRLRYPTATREERALRWKESGLDPAAFAQREQTVRTVTRQGVFLPAPAEASWAFTVSAGATFVADLQLLAPVLMAGPPSDGASLAADILIDGKVERVGEWPAGPNAVSVRADLSRFVGKSVTLRLSSLPGGQASKDYVFLGEPMVYTPKASPRRVVLVFVDTLRADHLGAYGYARPTSPNIDALAKTAVLFAQARSVSGWTLPSGQAALSGWLPSEWGKHPTLARRLSGLGFSTSAVLANSFLSPKFGLAQGWGTYAVDPTLSAATQVERALEQLKAHSDRDLALLVHVLDPHVPYEEPEGYRNLWAGAAPDGFPEKLDRAKLAAWLQGRALTAPDEATKQYITARYDQEIRYVDDQIQILLDAVGPDATVVLFSDHGEELWDHGGFEHGHTQYDELLHVPLLIRSPGLKATRVDAPVSLIDIAPTVVELVGGVVEDFGGQSLVAAARGDAEAVAGLGHRPQVFGWRLYGADQWGVLADGLKWTSEQGSQSVYDVRTDPREQTDVVSTTPLAVFPTQFESAAGFPMVKAWRVQPGHTGEPIAQDGVLTVTTPGGFSRVWSSYDYRGESAKNRFEYSMSGDDVRIVRPAGATAPGEIFLLPARALEGVDITARLEVGADSVALPGTGALQFVVGSTLVDLKVAGERWRIGPVLVAELPASEARSVSAETLEQIRALGYTD